MARRMTPNQKAWQREMLRIENMARSIGIDDVASIKPSNRVVEVRQKLNSFRGLWEQSCRPLFRFSNARLNLL